VGKGGRCVRLTTLPPSCAVVMKCRNLNFLEPSGPLQTCNGTALPLSFAFFFINVFRKVTFVILIVSYQRFGERFCLYLQANFSSSFLPRLWHKTVRIRNITTQTTFVFTAIDMRNSNSTAATPKKKRGIIFLRSTKEKSSCIAGSYFKIVWAVAFVVLITESSRVVRYVATHTGAD